MNFARGFVPACVTKLYPRHQATVGNSFSGRGTGIISWIWQPFLRLGGLLFHWRWGQETPYCPSHDQLDGIIEGGGGVYGEIVSILNSIIVAAYKPLPCYLPRRKHGPKHNLPYRYHNLNNTFQVIVLSNQRVRSRLSMTKDRRGTRWPFPIEKHC